MDSSHYTRPVTDKWPRFIDIQVEFLKPGFHYMANSTTTTQKQSDYKVEQSSFMLIALFWLETVIVIVVIGLMETKLKSTKITFC